MLLKKGEVVTVASGIFESYSREGPFVATQDFDLGACVAKAVSAAAETWEVSAAVGAEKAVILLVARLMTSPAQRSYRHELPNRQRSPFISGFRAR